MKPSKPSSSKRIRERSDNIENRGSEGNKMHIIIVVGDFKDGRSCAQNLIRHICTNNNVAIVTPPLRPHLRPSLSDRY